MSAMSFIGSYSGIDRSTIDKLMEAERMPLRQLTKRQLDINEKKDAWKDVNTRLNSLFEKMDALKKSSSFNTKLASSSDKTYVTMDAGNSAAEGRYDIEVKQLATNSNIVGSQILSPEQIDGKENTKKILNLEGSFRLGNSDAKSVEIQVEKTDSLQSIAEKINGAMTEAEGVKGQEDYKAPEKIGIRASVVDNRLVLKDEKTGDRSIALENLDGEGNPDQAGTTLEGLGLDESKWNPDLSEKNGQKNPGQLAIFTLNKIEITRSENRIADAIEGIAINLNKAHEAGQTASVNVSSDTEKAAKAMQDFVDQYNSTMKFIEDKTAAGDPKVVGSKGSLAGESSLIRLQSTIRKFVTDTVGVEGDSVRSAAQIGISTFDKSGTLVFDKDKFLAELNSDKDGVMNFLNPGKDKTGFVDRVNKHIDGFISKSNGVIKDKNDSFEKSLKDIASRMESFEDRMVKKEAYYVKTFTALDVAMMKAEDQMGWLQSQVDSMNGIKR